MARSYLLRREFWESTAERVLSTAIQVALALLPVDAMATGGITSIHWGQVLSIVALAALLSLLKCIVASQVSGSRGPSLVSSERLRSEPCDAHTGSSRWTFPGSVGLDPEQPILRVDPDGDPDL